MILLWVGKLCKFVDCSAAKNISGDIKFSMQLISKQYVCVYIGIRQGRLKMRDSPKRSTKNNLQWFVSKNNSMDFRALNVVDTPQSREFAKKTLSIWLHLHPIPWTYSTLWQEHEESYAFAVLTHQNPCGNLFTYPNLCVTAPTSPLNMFMWVMREGCSPNHFRTIPF